MCPEQNQTPGDLASGNSDTPTFMVGPLTRDQLAMLQNALFFYCEDEAAMEQQEDEKGYIDQDWCDLKNVVDKGWLQRSL